MLKKALVFLTATVALTMPVAAQSATGMDALQYYVGTWTCTGGNVGTPSQTATVTFTLDSGILREWIVVAAQGNMKNPYAISAAFSYDSKNDRFAQAGTDSISEWWVSYAKPWTGDTEDWTDQQNSTGKLGRSQIVRSAQDTYVYTGWETVTAPNPNFKVTCQRSK
jgi:hypothetical protein